MFVVELVNAAVGVVLLLAACEDASVGCCCCCCVVVVMAVPTNIKRSTLQPTSLPWELTCDMRSLAPLPQPINVGGTRFRTPSGMQG